MRIYREGRSRCSNGLAGGGGSEKVRSMRRWIGILVLSFLAVAQGQGWAADAKPVFRQLVVVTTEGWQTHRGQMRCFERSVQQGSWQAVGDSFPILLGKKGMAWGRGLHAAQEGAQKKEGDWRTPAGRFRIGIALGTLKGLPVGAHGWPYRRVTGDDAWIDDPAMPSYNQLVHVPQEPKPAWFARQRMKPEDPTYQWLLLIEHNYPKAQPGAGSAIFFHTRRGEDVPSSGCTVMERARLEELLRWLRPDAAPELVQLPLEEYRRFQAEWDLPPEAQLGTEK